MRIFSLILLIILFQSTIAFVGRHDCSSEHYQSYAYELTGLGPGEAVGRLEALEGEEYKHYGSCVLIDSSYILTAAHQQADIATGKPRVVFTDKDLNLRTVLITEWKQHPKYNSRLPYGYDLAIGKLSEAIINISSIPLSQYDYKSLDTKEGCFVGHGVWMRAGEYFVQDDGKKRAGKSIICLNHLSDAPIIYNYFNDPRICDTVNEYDFNCCSKDSGGPLLVQESGKYKIAGISSFSKSPKNRYGSNSGYSAISGSQNWILAVIQGSSAENDLIRATVANLSVLSSDITSLDLSNIQITGGDLKIITEHCPSLNCIGLSGCNITDDDLKYLQDMPLNELNLSRCTKITDKGLQYLPMSITKLDLSESNITYTGLKTLEKTLLTSLSLRECQKITGPGLNTGLKYLPSSITKLDLSGCSNIVGTGLRHLLNLSLTELDLTGCTKIRDLSTLRNFHCLTKLNLGGCINITDDALQYLQDVPLNELNLSGCIKITNKGLLYLFNCPKLKLLISPKDKNLKGDELQQFLKGLAKMFLREIAPGSTGIYM